MNSTITIIFDNINIDEVSIEAPAFIPRKGDEISLLWSGMDLSQEETPLSEDQLESLNGICENIKILVDDVIHTFYPNNQIVSLFVYAYNNKMEKKDLSI